MPHSNRVVSYRQDILAMRQDILAMRRRAAGMEGFEVHVQIIERMMEWWAGIDRRSSSLFLLAFF